MPYVLIAEKNTIKVFTFDLILRHKLRSKQSYSIYEPSSSHMYKNNDLNGTSTHLAQSIMNGEFGEEIKNIKNATTANSRKPTYTSVLSVPFELDSQSIQFENPRYFMLTDQKGDDNSLASVSNQMSVISGSDQTKSVINKINKVRSYLTTHLRLDDPKMFTINEPFELHWYKPNQKSSKHRLGKLMHA